MLRHLSNQAVGKPILQPIPSPGQRRHSTAFELQQKKLVIAEKDVAARMTTVAGPMHTNCGLGKEQESCH